MECQWRLLRDPVKKGAYLHHQHRRDLALHQTLDLPSPIDELGDESRQDTLLDIALRYVRDLLLSVGLLVQAKEKGVGSDEPEEEGFQEGLTSSSVVTEIVVKSMLYSWMIEGYKLLKSMTRTNLSHSPLFGSKTRPPLNLSRLPPVLVVAVAAPSPSSASALTIAALFLPWNLSGQIYLSLWNS